MPATSTSPVKVTKGRKKRKEQFLPLYMIYLFINNYIPMMGLIIAFKKVNFEVGILKSPFIGLKNFEYLFKTRDAWIITRNTIGYNALFIILGTVIAITVAILLNEVSGKRLKSFYQGVYLMPYLISIVVIAYVVYAFLSTDVGFINNARKAAGLKPIQWYTTQKYWPFILTLVNQWKSFGYMSIIYFATLVGIDRTYYEAAVVDGANRWQQIRFITLPLLKPTIITLTLLAIGRIFYSDFGLFYQVPMGSGPLIPVTNTIDTYVYRGLMQLGNLGMASASGFYQSIVGFILVLAANWIVSRISAEHALF